jgi:hypothetical protein
VHDSEIKDAIESRLLLGGFHAMCSGCVVTTASSLSAAPDDLATGIMANTHLVTQHNHHVYQGNINIKGGTITFFKLSLSYHRLL